MNKKDTRVAALIRFASAITALNIAGYLFLGFEQSYATVVTALLTGYSLEFLMEFLTAKEQKRDPKYKGGIKKFLVFLLPPHITSLAVSMLTFVNENLILVVFGVAVAILSKYLFKVNYNSRKRHFLNPSNTGIAVMFLVFPSVGPAPPYQFSEALSGIGDWILISVFIILGSFLNAKFTKKIPLIAAWLFFFFLQAIIRTTIFGTDTFAALAVMTGPAFLLFTYYMISDPSTTPFKFKNQIFFGAIVAVVYAITIELHLVFNLFFSLLIVCIFRGLYMWVYSLRNKEVIIPEVNIYPIEMGVVEARLSNSELTNATI
ncbi:hypothetical protein [Maribacter dokdonensis]|uniref:hypothetical protein n=1 Tax=Maribacter dokdonensis TaxID=320912 RepID=UPI001C0A44D1|nr:hypothetical protein [Maribacter dokdonensis]MBU2902970.1 hypothetical protein [Maribacter dokdonensis]